MTPPPTHTHTHAKDFYEICTYARFVQKEMETVYVTDYTKQAPQKCSGHGFNIKKNEKIYINTAQNRRCTFSICQESVGKV